MNTQLIPVFTGNLSGETAQLVDARLLHHFLQVGKDFSNWIKDRIEGYGFIRNQDYLEFSPNLAKTLKGRPAKDYHLSIDMAKELGMIERNDKGREIRRYFLDLEKSAKAMLKESVPMRTYVELQTKHIALQEKLLTSPKVAELKKGRWSEDELAELRVHRANGLGPGRISQAMGRTFWGIQHRIRVLENLAEV